MSSNYMPLYSVLPSSVCVCVCVLAGYGLEYRARSMISTVQTGAATLTYAAPFGYQKVELIKGQKNRYIAFGYGSQE